MTFGIPGALEQPWKPSTIHFAQWRPLFSLEFLYFNQERGALCPIIHNLQMKGISWCAGFGKLVDSWGGVLSHRQRASTFGGIPLLHEESPPPPPKVLHCLIRGVIEALAMDRKRPVFLTVSHMKSYLYPLEDALFGELATSLSTYSDFHPGKGVLHKSQTDGRPGSIETHETRSLRLCLQCRCSF